MEGRCGRVLIGGAVRGRSGLGTAVAVVALLLSGCVGYDPNPTVVVDNRTDQTVYFQPVGLDLLASSASPGGRGTIGPSGPGGCTGTEYVARWEDGTEVGRLPAPACSGEVWVIDGPAKDPDR